MKKSLAFILVLILLFSLGAEAFAGSLSNSKPDPVLLTGRFGEEECIRERAPAGSTTPFYLDKPVVNCKHVKLYLSIEEEDGDCAGNYYLYAMDFDEKWEHVGMFKVDKKRVNGKEYSYEFDLDKKSNFVALALWSADKEGRSCTGYFKYSVYVDPGCISEYSSRIPEPIFEPIDVSEQYIKIEIPGLPEYRNPWF